MRALPPPLPRWLFRDTESPQGSSYSRCPRAGNPQVCIKWRRLLRKARGLRTQTCPRRCSGGGGFRNYTVAENRGGGPGEGRREEVPARRGAHRSPASVRRADWALPSLSPLKPEPSPLSQFGEGADCFSPLGLGDFSPLTKSGCVGKSCSEGVSIPSSYVHPQTMYSALPNSHPPACLRLAIEHLG